MGVISVLSPYFSLSAQLLYQGSCPLTSEMLDKLNQGSFMKWD